MKTGQDYLDRLTKKQKSEWQENVSPYVKDWVLQTKFDSMRRFLGCSFGWEHTPQGGKYWGEIAYQQNKN